MTIVTHQEIQIKSPLMLEKFLETYGEVQDKTAIAQEHIDRFRDDLPAEIQQLLAIGAGSYMQGFFWIVDPADYASILDEVYIPLKTPSVCFARDAFANLYVWEDSTIYFLDLRIFKWKVVGRKASVFFNSIMTDCGYFMKQVNGGKFLEAKEKLGELEDDECYGNNPLTGMGGADNVGNLKKMKIREFISLSAQALGRIG